MERLVLDVSADSGRQITLTTLLGEGVTLTISRAVPDPKSIAGKDVTDLQLTLLQEAQKLLQHRLEWIAAGTPKA